ncbi:MFS transporter [Mycobacterium nebraskense]|uniref:MFS transporter n=1 Tax=Mycobacterium nebraskense TaxID=244292 RepID=A0A0F5N828_9MYCO|nr:MFS transporter [Mycobacterium nebraskense]KLO32484.1 MFS transporter [Mycobacterium nebraskense]MBI2696049.1 MFS transporter [Mycobacterium nebraskense]MCV7118116.1 MFS transporter [Mycobacterium nebraskense]ORW35663.1 MFS transporter [Mycobacterium nebraskense]
MSPQTPLRNRVYRDLFIAQFVSNIGTWMQTVAAQWFLVEKHSSTTIVALVQTASFGPTLLLGLLAGVLADLFDRRRLLILLQSYAVLVALALAVLTYLGRLGPASLLMFTVAIGCASALTAPAWLAIQPEVIPREQIPAAATLGSVAANAAQAVGPAIGGVVVALAGPAAVFGLNAVSFAGIIVALAAWKRPKPCAPIEREHLSQAIITGLLYVRNDPIFRRILLRAALFLFPASALLALLPMAAAHRWQLGASGYGVALGAIGFGAALAAVVDAARLRPRVSASALLAACAAAYGIAPLAVVWLPFAAATPILVLSGMSWLLTLSTLNAAAQLSLPRWVRARGLSVYLVVFTGCQAVGAYVWGVVATWAGLDIALICTAGLLGAAALSVAALPLRPSTGKLGLDIATACACSSPMVVFDAHPNDGPVLVMTHYRVSAENRQHFAEAMSAVRRSRLRTGGHSWGLYYGVEDPDTVIETFTVASWSEFQRQHTERWSDYDRVGVAKALDYTVDNTRRHRYFLALHVSR